MNKRAWGIVALAWVALLGLVAITRLVACTPIAPGRVRAPPAVLGEGASRERLERHVRHLAESIGARNDRHPAAMHASAEYVAAALEAAGARVSRQPVPVGRPHFENIVARFGPEDRAPIVVGAHYDSFRDTVGADDDASGVAGVLELARLLGAMRSPPAVELVAYAMEEPPYFRTSRMGSAVHARARRGAPIRAMIALEMIGFFRDEPGSQDYPSIALGSRMPDEGDFVAVIGRTEDEPLALAVRDAMSIHRELRVYAHVAPASTMGIDFSDHRSYWARGIPAVMVTDTAFLRNRAYHTVNDTADRLDYQRMAWVVDGVFAAIVATE